MKHERHPEGGIVVTFEDSLEVEAARAAFEEHAAHLIALGNDSSVSDYQKTAILRWDGDSVRCYRAGNPKQLVERLAYFHEVTEERVSELLAETMNPDRVADSARRYQLGAQASGLLKSIEIQSSIDTEWESMHDR